MYKIQPHPQLLSSAKSIERTTTLGLGLSLLRFCFGIYSYNESVCLDDIQNSFDGQSHFNEKQHHGLTNNHGGHPVSEELATSNRKTLQISHQEFGRCIIIGVILYVQLFLFIVDAYLYRFLLRATQKENVCNCWLGLYLQISLLAYNVAEILIDAHNGVFDGSSMLLAARAVARALSIEMVYLFLQEIEDKRDADLVFFYIIFNVILLSLPVLIGLFFRERRCRGCLR